MLNPSFYFYTKIKSSSFIFNQNNNFSFGAIILSAQYIFKYFNKNIAME